MVRMGYTIGFAQGQAQWLFRSVSLSYGVADIPCPCGSGPDEWRRHRIDPYPTDILQCQGRIVPGERIFVPVLSHGHHLDEGWLGLPRGARIAELMQR